MWEYNYDYLSHGLRGYKYIERKRGKNGKWQYVYPDSAEGERIDAGRRVEEGINHPLTNPNRALLYGRTPGASVPKTKPSIARNGKASDNTATTTSPKTGTSSKEAVKNLGTEIAGKFKDAYDKTLGSEDFKKYKQLKEKTREEQMERLEKLSKKRDEATVNFWRAALNIPDYDVADYRDNPDKDPLKDVRKEYEEAVRIFDDYYKKIKDTYGYVY